jgi:hypothetical protein
MKTPIVPPVLTLSLSLAIFVGCKKEEPVSPAAKEAPSAPTEAAPAAKLALPSETNSLATEGKTAVEETTTSVKETIQATTEAAKQAVTQLAPQSDATAGGLTTQVQGIIKKAQDLVGEKKYQDALSALQQLANLTLTPEQQKVVDDIKAQIQKAVASQTLQDAAKSIPNPLK